MGSAQGLAEFKVKRDRWVDCLRGNDHNSIYSQLVRLIWEAATFNIVLEARRIAPKTPEGGAKLSGLVHGLLDNCFFDSQSAAIRRLTDRYPLEGPKGVNSLAALIADMESNVRFLTRGNLISAESLPSDLEPLREELKRFECDQINRGITAFFLPDNGYQLAIARHELIDRITRTTSSNRSSADQVDPALLRKLSEILKRECGEVHTYVDKFVAHNATADSRSANASAEISLTLGHLRRAHRCVCVIGNFLGVYLLGGSSFASLAHPVFDHLQYVDRPLITEDDLPKLADAWKRYDRETQSWSGDGLNAIELELGLAD